MSEGYSRKVSCCEWTPPGQGWGEVSSPITVMRVTLAFLTPLPARDAAENNSGHDRLRRCLPFADKLHLVASFVNWTMAQFVARDQPRLDFPVLNPHYMPWLQRKIWC